MEQVKPIFHQITVKESIKGNHLRVSIIPPPSVTSRTNSNICCVVDVSGSMSTNATLKDQSSQSSEKYNLSILDIVQHALKMIVNTLTPEDNLSVVAFSSRATVIFDFLKMEDANKEYAISQIEKLDASGSTNLWDGIRTGLNLLAKVQNNNRNSAMYVLTDGQPDNSNILGPLRQFKKEVPKLRCTISTFGFGNACDSILLDSVAREYNGMYSFIPDATLIATAFANALANTLTVFANYVKLRVTSLNGFKFKVPEYQPTSSLSKPNDVIVYGGVVNIQQNRDFIFDIVAMPSDETAPYAKVEVTYQESYLSNSGEPIPDQVVKAELVSRESDEDIDNHIYRYKVIEAIVSNMSKDHSKETIKNNLMTLIEEMEGIHDQNDRHFDGIYKDLVRTVSEAFKDDNIFKTWGQHYLLSLLRAHLIQQCNTFKDPGVQHYGKATFQAVRGIADEIFVKMPPPKPYSQSAYFEAQNQPTVQQVSNNSSSSSSYTSSYNMNDYHNYSSGGCMHGESLVLTSDSIYKKVSEIQKGDRIISPALGNGEIEVECVVLSKCDTETREFISLGSNLWITPKHPVRVNGEWRYPKDLGEVIEKSADFIYQFVLKSGHTMNIGGFECICLGHGFQENIAYHPYLGSKSVIEDLKQMKGWKEGKILISSRVRDQTTGQVKAFIQ